MPTLSTLGLTNPMNSHPTAMAKRNNRRAALARQQPRALQAPPDRRTPLPHAHTPFFDGRAGHVCMWGWGWGRGGGGEGRRVSGDGGSDAAAGVSKWVGAGASRVVCSLPLFFPTPHCCCCPNIHEHSSPYTSVMHAGGSSPAAATTGKCWRRWGPKSPPSSKRRFV